jgi:cysteine sulfinate desulfinase/cysteine desulfurase-like protein
MTIYLDHNATTPLLPEVIEGMLPLLREHFGNLSSSHAFGHVAREAVERAQAQVAELDCLPDEVIFTSGGGETASAVLLAMGVDPLEALGAVRLSVGVTTTMDEVDAAGGPRARLA